MLSQPTFTKYLRGKKKSLFSTKIARSRRRGNTCQLTMLRILAYLLLMKSCQGFRVLWCLKSALTICEIESQPDVRRGEPKGGALWQSEGWAVEGGGIQNGGVTCMPMADSCPCKTQPITRPQLPPCKIDTLSQVFNQSNAGFIMHLKKVKNISTNRAIFTNKGWMKQGSFLETGYRFNLGNKPRWFTVTTEDRGIESLWPQETQESQLANVSVHLCSSKCMESQKKMELRNWLVGQK